MSPVRWRRRRSSDHQELHLYNIRQQLVVVETPERSWTPGRRDVCSREKRNPLLERVKNTKLSCFRSAVLVGQTDVTSGVPLDDCERFVNLAVSYVFSTLNFYLVRVCLRILRVINREGKCLKFFIKIFVCKNVFTI